MERSELFTLSSLQRRDYNHLLYYYMYDGQISKILLEMNDTNSYYTKEEDSLLYLLLLSNGLLAILFFGFS